MELKLRFIFIISCCWPGGLTPYRIRRCPDWGYLGADKFERGLSQVPGPTRIGPREDIGVQCELGSEVYYKYSNLFEDESGDESVHSAQLSEVHSTCSDVEKDALKSPARKRRRRASVNTHQQ
jgi:hypothetical protein